MKVFNHIFILFIRVYKLLISPVVGANCRYQPTCSTYCLESLEKYNIIYALYLCLKRIFSCNPFGGSGHDPVP